MGKRFLVYIITTIVMAMALSTAYYYSVCHGLRHTKEFFFGRLNCILYDSTRYDAVFMGASKVTNDIDPMIFDSLAHLRSYNAGTVGASYSAIDIFTRRFVANHHPKYVFIGLDIDLLKRENSLYDFPQYYPYLQDSDIAVLSKRKREMAFGKYAPFIAVSYMNDYLKGVAYDDWLDIRPADDLTYSHRGFFPAVVMDFQGTPAPFPLAFTYDTANFKKLDALCRYCTDRHCEIIFIMTPLYGVFENGKTNSAAFYARIRTLESKYRIRELNFYIDSRFTKKMFSNKSHLNHKGAILFSRILADSFVQISKN
jgi:hypothetical protein